MSSHWSPKLVTLNRTRRKRRRQAATNGELRLMLIGGVILGLAFAGIPVDGSATSAGAAAIEVIDGDTFDYGGDRIRIADIDTPETHPPRCAHEALLGARATQRLEALLEEGPFELEAVDRDEDRYGRKLRIVTREGRSIGATLVAEGLARPWEGRRRSWCA